MKSILKIAAWILWAAALTVLLLQHRALSNARSENRSLQSKSREAQRLTRENAGIERLRAENQEMETLRNETRDLHKLRNDVRQLRDQKPVLEKLRAENQQLRAGTSRAGGPASRASDDRPPVTKEMLADAGLGSPEAAMQTFFWAMREKNVQRIRACLSEDAGREIQGQPDEEVLAGAGPTMDTFKEFQIVAKKVVSADEVKLGIHFSTREGAVPEEVVLPFKRVAGEWKINIGPPH